MDSFCLFDCLAEHLAIEIISHRIHMSMLLCTQQISRASKFQISHGNFKSTSQIRIFTNSRQTLLRSLLQHHVLPVHQECIRRSVRSTDSSAKLIKLGKSVSVGIMDDHGIYIGNIQPCFNDRSRNQYINITIYKRIHDILKFSLAHLSMCKIHPRIRHKFRYAQGNIRNIRNTVIDIIDLSAPAQFSVDRLPDCLLIILHNIGLNRHSVHRRFLKDTHITNSNEAHMQSTRNRRCCQSQHIYILFQLLDFLFMRNPETLFLIDDQKSKVLKLYILRQDSMCSDNYIYLSLFQVFNRFLLLRRRTETTEKFYSYRELFHSLYKGVVYLLCKNSCRGKIRHLSALLHFLKCSAQSNLCFTITYVTADQTVHNFRALHIPLGIFNGAKLIFCLLIWKHFLELPLPYRIRTTDIAFLFLTYRVELYQLFRNIFDSSPDLAFRLIPFLCSKLIQFRSFCRITARVFLKTV